MRSSVALAGAGSGIVFALALVVVGTSDTADSPVAITVAVLAGVSWIVAGLIALMRYPEYRTGWLMIAAGDLWAISALQLSSVPLLFTLGVALGQVALGPWIQLTMGFPEGRLRNRVDRALVMTTYVALIAVPTFEALFDPEPLPSCDGCPDTLAIADRPTAVSAVAVLGGLLAAALAAIYIVRLVRRYQAASPPLRRILGPVYVATVGALLAIIAMNTASLVWESSRQIAAIVTVVLFGAVPVAFLVGLLRIHLARGSVAGFLGTMREGGSLRDALADTLGDPSLAIVYPLESRWVDEEGRDAERIVSAEDTILTPVVADGEIVAGLVHDVSLAYDSTRLEAVADAAALALRAQGLQAEARGQFAFLLTLVETAPSLFIHVGADGVIRNQNAAAVEAAGYSDEEHVRGRHFWDVFIDPSERDEVIARFRALAPTFEQGEYENAFTNARGEERVIFWRSAPVLTESGEVAGIISGGIDITARRHHELELERERDVQSTVFESMPSIMVVLAPDGTIRDRDADDPSIGANRAFREAVSWPDEEIVGRPFLDLVVEDADGRARGAIAAAARGEASETVESELRSADGTSRIFAWSAIPVADVTGRMERLVLVSGIDVTERRRQELEDRRRREFMEAVTGTIPSFLLVLRPDGTVREFGANKAFETTFGWSDAEIAGRRFVGAITPASDLAASMVIAKAAEGVIQDEIESRWETRTGESRIVAWSARPVMDTHGEHMVLVSGMDVTTRRLQEEEIRASRSRIVAAADEARRRLERDLHDGAQQRLVSLSVMLSLAESRLQAGSDGVGELLTGARSELSLALEELRELARGIHPAVLTDRGLGPALQALAARTPIPVSLEFPDEKLPSDVEAAAYFVAAEALTNVVKYAHASEAAVEIALNGESVSVSVRDDGIGGADPGKGSGLRGLSDRLSSLDGRLAVQSAPGGGTCVRAEIPYGQATRN